VPHSEVFQFEGNIEAKKVNRLGLFFSIDWLFDLVVSNKGIVFYLANVSVSSAYLAKKGSF